MNQRSKSSKFILYQYKIITKSITSSIYGNKFQEENLNIIYKSKIKNYLEPELAYLYSLLDSY
jgi:hypothetical protein